MGDTEAMRFTHPQPSLRACRLYVALYEFRRRSRGYAPWTVSRKQDGRIIGWGGLYDDAFDPGWGVEAVYFFDKAAWGQGFASELVRAAVSVADTALQLPLLTAFAHKDNAGSCRVLEKAGFSVERYVPEMDRLLFRRPRQPG